MSENGDFVISWRAGIVPSQSLAGIPLGISVEDFEKNLSRYVIDESRGLYKFQGSPILTLGKELDSNGDGGYGFSVFDRELTGWRLYFSTSDHAGADPRALYVIVRSWKVFAVKVWMFENLRLEELPVNSYAGKLQEGIGLGDLVSEFLKYTELDFDDAEEWFCTDENYGGLEVTGYGGDLSESPDQTIRALTVISRS
ncbi:hypothetical protein [Pseudomonas gingeri]|uniref:hypothetical protein n=1 Tax=Pseudomonas gingeri TaxID=117681 RepID=UPI001C4335AA|nr:hypothetical protein [Pseudomonas gingeri]